MGAKNDTCEKYEEMEKHREGAAKYELKFADENDLQNPKHIVAPMKCRLNKDGETIFEIDNEDIDMFMDVVNPEFKNQKK